MLICVGSKKNCCSAKISVMVVAIILFIVALILIGFMLMAVLLAVKLDSLTSVSLSDVMLLGDIRCAFGIYLCIVFRVPINKFDILNTCNC